jgi:ferric-dicitrate binding protein FerR (iron transport regulator)
MQGGMAFEDTPLRDVARELERTYDLTVTIADSALAKMPVTGSFPSAPVDEVLDAMTRVVGARFQRSGRVVTIRRGVVPAGRAVPGERDAMQFTRAESGR